MHRSVKNDLLVVGVTVLPSERPMNTVLAAIDEKALHPRIAERGLTVPIELKRLLPEKNSFTIILDH